MNERTVALCGEPEILMDNRATPFERREFLKRLGLVGAGLMLGGPLSRSFAAEVAKSDGRVPQRKFGRHDFTVPMLALGGHALRIASDDEAAKMIDAAIEVGATFLDNSWDYHRGTAEELMGRVITGKRDQFFLMSKVCTHDKADDYALAMRMLDESLKRLKTDHLDLWQWHAVATPEQVKLGFSENGVVKALTDAKKQGKVRFVGFTGHTDPDVHLAVLAHEYPFDTCQLPVSAIEANSNAFVRRVLPEVVRQGIAPLAMKTLGGNAAPVRDQVVTVAEGLNYAWSQPITTIVSGVTSAAQLRENAKLAAAFHAMSPEQLAALEERVKPATEAKKYQPYRHWMSYRDGDSLRVAGLV
jgi:predicted aldo/keto reductase-like oxidoreductase